MEKEVENFIEKDIVDIINDVIWSIIGGETDLDREMTGCLSNNIEQLF
jgi:hypothetical protein